MLSQEDFPSAVNLACCGCDPAKLTVGDGVAIVFKRCGTLLMTGLVDLEEVARSKHALAPVCCALIKARHYGEAYVVEQITMRWPGAYKPSAQSSSTSCACNVQVQHASVSTLQFSF